MKKFIKENWFKLIIALCFILIVLTYIYSQFNKLIKSSLDDNLNLATTTIDTKLTNLNDDICKTATFTPPLASEITFNNQIKQDEFIKYLRRSIDDFLSSQYIPCVSSSCINGLIDGTHYADSAYSDLGRIDPAYLRSNFIVLSTDIAPGGGESIVLMFKNKPDKMFYAWVYGYNGEISFDLRGFSIYEGAPSVKEVQKMFINQLCGDDFGL